MYEAAASALLLEAINPPFLSRKPGTFWQTLVCLVWLLLGNQDKLFRQLNIGTSFYNWMLTASVTKQMKTEEIFCYLFRQKEDVNVLIL